MAYPPLVPPGPDLTGEQRARYARHLSLPEIGVEGQRRLCHARVLLVGAGGLGSPALLYLAAAGIGTLGIIDDDVVSESNLHRQVVHGVADVGVAKTISAAQAVARLDPTITVVQHRLRLQEDNAVDLLRDYDLVLDGADNFTTRYLINDACVRLGTPHVWGSVLRFDGQVSVWWPGVGPCLRCVFPAPPPAGSVASCAVAGVLGSVCAAVASAQVTEAIKLLCGIGDPLVGRLLMVDALGQRSDELIVKRNPNCPVCRPGLDLGPVIAETGCDAIEPDRGAASILTAPELAGLLARGEVTLIDVREPDERAATAIAGSIHVPLDAVRNGWRPSQAGTIVVHCASGIRSAEAARLLSDRGVTVADLAGGILGWVDAGFPVHAVN
ncbi:MAG: ThiF family adenylyltransferase [Nostocoides sp.]